MYQYPAFANSFYFISQIIGRLWKVSTILHEAKYKIHIIQKYVNFLLFFPTMLYANLLAISHFLFVNFPKIVCYIVEFRKKKNFSRFSFFTMHLI